RTDKPIGDLRPFERKMIEGIFRGKQSRDLDSLRYKFADRLPSIRKDLYKELETRGYVRTSPESVRNRYGCFGFMVLGAAVLAFFVPSALFGSGLSLAICPAIALGITGIVFLVTGRFMPSKTQAGAEAAAAWLAFGKYLQDIEKYTNLAEATDIFQKYLGYAVAFGLERSWIRKFSAIPSAPIPPWYLPYPYYGGVGHAGRPGGSVRGGTSGSGGSRVPSLEGMSGGLAGGLAGMSAGLSRMLTNTQTVLQSTRSSSSSGGGGGFSGGFSGGSSGGGGGGFG
ncbi:MAG TPA: hypothetical protein VE553_09605, partial [Candidatus Binatia bacterium]|nr:hypothetical protein [Candidatus Binatia bacterium]